MSESTERAATNELGVRSLRLRVQTIADIFAGLLESHKYWILVLYSVCYFVVTCYRASRKLFWFDELFTVYIANLPSVGAMWQALLHGADFNPPLLYLLTRWSEAIAGHTQLGARLPEIVGFWIFCLCLFRFVYVRAGVLGGLIAMLFPMVTMAYWYSYEARSHGLVLGFCGLALVCWQGAASEKNRRYWWIAGLAASLVGAMLTHSYAFLLLVPFGMGELARAIFSRRIDWPVWLTIAISSSAILISLPLLHAVHRSYGHQFLPASLRAFIAAYQSLFEPAVDVLAASLLLLCVGRILSPRRLNATPKRNGTVCKKIRPHELAALLGFLLIPAVCFVASSLAGAPMLQRYSLSMVTSVACILGISIARNFALGVAISFLLVAQVSIDFTFFRAGNVTAEPSTALILGQSVRLSTSRGWYNERYNWISSDSHANLPVLLLSNLDFSPAFYYAPAKILSRLVYVPTDSNGEEYVQLQKCCHARGQLLSFQSLLSRSKVFLAFGPPTSYWIIEHFRRTGASVSTERISEDYGLFLVAYPPDKPVNP